MLRLSGRTVLVVTGGRVGLGFEVALRLLRCGAVVVSLRYLWDAERRLRGVGGFWGVAVKGVCAWGRTFGG